MTGLMSVVRRSSSAAVSPAGPAPMMRAVFIQPLFERNRSALQGFKLETMAAATNHLGKHFIPAESADHQEHQAFVERDAEHPDDGENQNSMPRFLSSVRWQQ